MGQGHGLPHGCGLWVTLFEHLPKELQLRAAVEVLEGLLLPRWGPSVGRGRRCLGDLSEG